MKNSPSCAHVLHKTLNLVISCCCFCRGRQRNVQKHINACAELLFLLIKPIVLWRSRCRRRRRILRSLLINSDLMKQNYKRDSQKYIREGVSCVTIGADWKFWIEPLIRSTNWSQECPLLNLCNMLASEQALRGEVWGKEGHGEYWGLQHSNSWDMGA